MDCSPALLLLGGFKFEERWFLTDLVRWYYGEVEKIQQFFPFVKQFSCHAVNVVSRQSDLRL